MRIGRIACKRQELDLGITLNGGQSFRWLAIENGAKYRGVYSGCVWTFSQDDENLHYVLHNSSINDETTCSNSLKKYFNLETSLRDSINEWSSCDAQFEKSCNNAVGVRILDQDIVENLFSFICSSNNNIPRISSMVEKMCTHFGKKICQVDKKQYYDFPTIEALSQAKVENILRNEGFGYRAAYIANAAKKLKELGGREWLNVLHKSKGGIYEKSRESLITLPGIGPKVADCICLMSLGHLEAIPVDTHIFQVAREMYMPHLKNQKTVTPKIHEQVSTYLRKLWGPHAGWAQTIVFCSKIGANEKKTVRRKQKNASDTKESTRSKKLKKTQT
ncbi:N-glycosylase/DNA lyase [Venturia canescens]|uniref:N-glycosylase/DNA lyase n=1 Tax=Venturia canescens TaxID=32260 RepID=UPI001C9C22DC|nr:N-glycosylase/DNA lyase [Venturia canescens]